MDARATAPKSAGDLAGTMTVGIFSAIVCNPETAVTGERRLLPWTDPDAPSNVQTLPSALKPTPRQPPVAVFRTQSEQPSVSASC